MRFSDPSINPRIFITDENQGLPGEILSGDLTFFGSMPLDAGGQDTVGDSTWSPSGVQLIDRDFGAKPYGASKWFSDGDGDASGSATTNFQLSVDPIDVPEPFEPDQPLDPVFGDGMDRFMVVSAPGLDETEGNGSTGIEYEPIGVSADLLVERGAADDFSDFPIVFAGLGRSFGDEVFADNFGEKLKGGKGDDAIFGGDGFDKLKGGKGDDFLDGGLGDDILKGGKGEDVFAYVAGDDLIKDFRDDDLLDLSGLNNADFDAVMANAVQDGKHLLLDLTDFGGDQLTLKKTDFDDLTSDHFFFG